MLSITIDTSDRHRSLVHGGHATEDHHIVGWFRYQQSNSIAHFKDLQLYKGNSFYRIVKDFRGKILLTGRFQNCGFTPEINLF